jgi:endonuclease G, mitochondrial
MKTSKIRNLIILCCFIFLGLVFSVLLETCKSSGQPKSTSSVIDFKEAFYPAPIKDEQIISHSAIRISYNETHEQANWVAYVLTKNQLQGTEKRKDKFLPDPKVSTLSAHPTDYSKSGYDRGHLAPAADFKWSSIAMAESFYMSNISPQIPGFNRGIWKKLEEQVRLWAMDNEELYVVTAGVLIPKLPTIGKNEVSVPAYFFKALLDLKEPELKAIAFIMPNKGYAEPLQNFAVTIDSLEKFTGINFFHQLDDGLEEKLESKIDLEKWFR